MNKFCNSIYLALPGIIMLPAAAVAATYWLPDYQAAYSRRSNETNRPPQKYSCAAYGNYTESCDAPKSGTPVNGIIPGLTCWKNCACPQEYKYNNANCQPPFFVGGTNCDGNYTQCNNACADYQSECPEGYAKTAPFCPYSADYGNCCNTCPAYPYTEKDIPAGYLKGEGCSACGNVTKYKAVINPCTGFPTDCECGYDKTSSSCQSGSQTRYKLCKSCCSADFIYTAANCPAPHKLTGEACNGKYKKCELDETAITCDNFTMPSGADYIKLVNTCDDLTSAVNSGQTGNIVIMKTLTCPTSLTLKSGQNLVSIGYFLKLTKESNNYKNQLNQCYTLTLNNYLYTSSNSGVSDLTLFNTPLYLKGATTLRNLNMRVTTGQNGIEASAKNYENKMSGMVNIYTNGSNGIYNAAVTMTDTKLNLKPIGNANRGFYKSNITISGNSVINIDFTGGTSQDQGEAMTDGNLTLNDRTSVNIRSNLQYVEAFNGDISAISGTNTFIYLNSPDVTIRAQITGNSTNTWVHRPYFQYQSGNNIMTINGNYQATASTSAYFSDGHTPSGSWSRTGEADFSASSEFGQQMSIFSTEFFR